MFFVLFDNSSRPFRSSTHASSNIIISKSFRQIHHLVGHAQKVTCVRFSGDGSTVISGSADRSLKVWDIRARTYRQTVTLRHSSTCNCVDAGSNGVDVVSGHHDGGLRFWDVRTGERTMDIPGESFLVFPRSLSYLLSGFLISKHSLIAPRFTGQDCTITQSPRFSSILLIAHRFSQMDLTPA